MTVLPAVIAVELVGVALTGQALAAGESRVAEETPFRYTGPQGAFAPITPPDIDPGVYLSEGPIAKAMQAGQGQGRYITFDPTVARQYRKWYLLRQEPQDWPAYANGRSVLFGLNEAQGYSPIQPFRYWSLVRRVNRDAPIFYNTAFFQQLDPAVLRLLAVEWIIQPADVPAQGMEPVAREGHYVLYRLPRPTPRASVVLSWENVPPGQGLDRMLDPRFDGERTAIVEGAGPLPAATEAGAPTGASYAEPAPERVRVRVRTPAPALVVIRNSYDPNWVARVDDVPADVHVADYLLQGVMVPAGTHLVELTYRDDAIGEGLIVSGAAWSVFMGTIAGAWIGGRKRRSNDAGERPRLGLAADHMAR